MHIQQCKGLHCCTCNSVRNRYMQNARLARLQYWLHEDTAIPTTRTSAISARRRIQRKLLTLFYSTACGKIFNQNTLSYVGCNFYTFLCRRGVIFTLSYVGKSAKMQSYVLETSFFSVFCTAFLYVPPVLLDALLALLLVLCTALAFGTAAGQPSLERKSWTKMFFWTVFVQNL